MSKSVEGNLSREEVLELYNKIDRLEKENAQFKREAAFARSDLERLKFSQEEDRISKGGQGDEKDLEQATRRLTRENIDLKRELDATRSTNQELKNFYKKLWLKIIKRK